MEIKTVVGIDLERIALGDAQAMREAIKKLQDALNREIVLRAQLEQRVTALGG